MPSAYMMKASNPTQFCRTHEDRSRLGTAHYLLAKRLTRPFVAAARPPPSELRIGVGRRSGGPALSGQPGDPLGGRKRRGAPRPPVPSQALGEIIRTTALAPVR